MGRLMSDEKLRPETLGGVSVAGLTSSEVAERAVLSATLLNGQTDPDVTTDLFFRSHNRIIYASMRRLTERGIAVDAATLTDVLRDRRELDDAGGPGYIAELLDDQVRGANIGHYVRILREKARRRNIIARCRGLIEAACDDTPTPKLRELIEGLGDECDAGSPIPHAVDLWGSEITPQRPEFVVRGLFRKVGLHLIWAQPGGYKTSLMLRGVHELVMEPQPKQFLGHPDLVIYSGYKRVLIITTEEDGAELRHIAQAVCGGLNGFARHGEVRHLYATGKRRITLDDLPEIIDTQGPFDLVVLDSLTGLRPKLVGGERVRWDVDNDSANELMLTLRGLAAEHQMAFWLIHHSDKKGSNYRGPTDWWASCDGMFGLLPENGRIKVKPQKVRGGRVPKPFLIEPEWVGDRLDIRYVGEAEQESLTPIQQQVLAFLRGRGETPQSIIPDQVDANRGTVGKALHRLESLGLVERTAGGPGKTSKWVAVESATPTGLAGES
jgi:hypothetical protein